MTWADYPQMVSVARGPRSIFPDIETNRILRAARDSDSIMADASPIRPVTAVECAGFRRARDHAAKPAGGAGLPPSG